MNLRDLSLLERLPSLLDELIEACKPGGAVSLEYPTFASDATRKSMALKGAVQKLRTALDEAGPPPTFAKPRPPLYLRVGDAEVREIAALLGHYGAPEEEFYALTKRLAGELGNERVSEAMREPTWIDVEKRWVRLRPEVIKTCRPWIGPFPADEDLEHWWKDRGGPPKPRSPDDPRPAVLEAKPQTKESAGKQQKQTRKKPVKK